MAKGQGEAEWPSPPSVVSLKFAQKDTSLGRFLLFLLDDRRPLVLHPFFYLQPGLEVQVSVTPVSGIPIGKKGRKTQPHGGRKHRLQVNGQRGPWVRNWISSSGPLSLHMNYEAWDGTSNTYP